MTQILLKRPGDIIPTTQAYHRMVGQNRAAMAKATRLLSQGSITPAQWADRIDASLLDGHTRAWIMGRRRSGDFSAESHDDYVRGVDAKDRQGEFLTGFLQAIKDKDPRYFDADGKLREAPINHRLDLYCGAMRGTANESFVESSPEEAEFDWVLGGAEKHCRTCPMYASMSPFTRDTMPAVPGGGDTECLGNCLCHLRRRDGVTSFGANPNRNDEEEAPPETPAPTPEPDEPPPSDAPTVSALADSFDPVDTRAKRLQKKVFDIIDQVLTVDASRQGAYTFAVDDLGYGVLGEHEQLTAIVIDPEPGQQIPTALHEVGHAFDAAFLNVGKGKVATKGFVYASVQAVNGVGPLAEWWRIVTETNAVKQLEALAKDPILWDDQRKHVRRYLLNSKEIWARAFAQFFAASVKDGTLAKEWRLASKAKALRSHDVLIQWSDEDFQKVKEAMENIFKDRGWM